MDDDTPERTDDGHLDVEAERERLERLRRTEQEVERQAADDLTMGGPGRTFSDSGVRAQVEDEGDTEHPLADR